MEDGLESSAPLAESIDRVKTPDGQRVFLFRYDNPEANNRNPNSTTSHEDLVGQWYTDSPKSLKTYILMRPAGGRISTISVENRELEALRASNHPTAKDMDIEWDNFIIPTDLAQNATSFPIEIDTGIRNKYIFSDRGAISQQVDDIVAKLTKADQQAA